MNKIFADHIRALMEVNIDDMLVKATEGEKLFFDLETVFNCLCKHKIKLNPYKCAFVVKTGKF